MNYSWFRLNKWKTGWVPVTWQGWILTLGYLGLIIYNFLRIDSTSHSVSDTLISFIPQTLLFTGIFSVICYFTAEKAAGKEILE